MEIDLTQNTGGADLVFDVTEENFLQAVIEGSQETPVIVDIWAPRHQLLRHAIRSAPVFRLQQSRRDPLPHFAAASAVLKRLASKPMLVT